MFQKIKEVHQNIVTVARHGDHYAHIGYCGLIAFFDHGAHSYFGIAMLIFVLIESLGGNS